MSLISIIKNKLHEIIRFNKISVKDVNIKYEPKVSIDRMKKEAFYVIKIYFNSSNVLLDEINSLSVAFVVRFKVFRCFIDFKNNCLKFYLKKNDIETARRLHDF